MKPRLKVVPIDDALLSLEELEQRLEAALSRLPGVSPSGAEFETPALSAGLPCLCDGRECVVVCDLHCLVHYL